MNNILKTSCEGCSWLCDEKYCGIGLKIEDGHTEGFCPYKTKKKDAVFSEIVKQNNTVSVVVTTQDFCLQKAMSVFDSIFSIQDKVVEFIYVISAGKDHKEYVKFVNKHRSIECTIEEMSNEELLDYVAPVCKGRWILKLPEDVSPLEVSALPLNSDLLNSKNIYCNFNGIELLNKTAYCNLGGNRENSHWKNLDKFENYKEFVVNE